MSYDKSLEDESIFILREAYAKVRPLVMLWSIGKDSNVLVWLARKAFFGRVPFPVVHIDTGRKFPEMYAFRHRYAREWGLDLSTPACPPIEEMDPNLPPAARSAARKTAGLKNFIDRTKVGGIIAGIRRDEQAIRAKERIFSPRALDSSWQVANQPPEFWNLYMSEVPPGHHLRIHPLLNWSEIDIWRYIRAQEIPVVDLYFAKNGKRYRSLGDHDITSPVDSNAADLDAVIAELEATKVDERSGRAMDHEAEDAFERLRVAGYM
jgi:sulfate adenylyltransferase subunit 2